MHTYQIPYKILGQQNFPCGPCSPQTQENYCRTQNVFQVQRRSRYASSLGWLGLVTQTMVDPHEPLLLCMTSPEDTCVPDASARLLTNQIVLANHAACVFLQTVGRNGEAFRRRQKLLKARSRNVVRKRQKEELSGHGTHVEQPCLSGIKVTRARGSRTSDPPGVPEHRTPQAPAGPWICPLQTSIGRKWSRLSNGSGLQ